MILGWLSLSDWWRCGGSASLSSFFRLAFLAFFAVLHDTSQCAYDVTINGQDK